MTLLNSITIAGAFTHAVDTARRADAEAQATTSAEPTPRAAFIQPLWAALGGRTA